jgi:probable HAF family extracellular repeat protein
MPARRGTAQAPPITTYTITDLGTLGGTESRAYGINECGQVVGTSSPSGSSPKHPFIWRDVDVDGFSDPGDMQDLGTLPGGNSGTAYGINSTAYAVGDADAFSIPRAFIWHDNNGNGVSDSCELQDLGGVPFDYTFASDINDANQVVGGVESVLGETEAFTWQNGVLQELPTLHSITPSVARGINNAGRIVGIAANQHAFVYTGATNIDLGTFGGVTSIAFEITEDNFVVGYSETEVSGNGRPHAFIWNDVNGDNLAAGEVKDLGTIDGTATSTSFAYDINSSHQVVGSSTLGSGELHAFIWQDDGDGTPEPGEMKDLNTLFSDASWTTLQEARSINDAGQIVGYGLKASGEIRAFLLTPATGFVPTSCPNTPVSSVAVTVSPTSVAENGVTNLIYTFTRCGLTTSALTINFSVSGSAIFGSDYTQDGAASFNSSSGTVTFAPNSPTATVTLDPITDSDDEPNETAVLTVTSGSGYTVSGPSSATGTIIDVLTPEISISNVTQAESDGGTSFVFTVTLSKPSSSTITVDYTTAAGTTNPATGGASCDSGTDYKTTSGKLTFDPNVTSQPIIVTVCGDGAVEPNETFFVNLSNATNSLLPPGTQGTGTIINDDTDVTVAVSPLSVPEDGATNLVYTFTRNGVTSGPLTVSFSVGGTATLTTDYAQTGATSFDSSSGSVTFGAGLAIATLTVDPTTDTSVEEDETAILTLTSGSGYNVASPSAATGTINNDDTDVSLSVSPSSPSSVTEDGATNLVYTFTRTGVTSNALTVNFSVGGTATFSNDYTQTGAASFASSSGTVAFGAGDLTKTVTVDPTADVSTESDETVILTLTSRAGYNVANSNPATGTITNDDTDVTISVSPQSVLEDGAANLVFTLTRNGVTSGVLTVNLAVSGTATFGTDYTQTGFSSSSGTVIFDAGSATATVTVDPTSDSLQEQDETVILFVTAGAGYNVGLPSTVTGTITNDDAPLVQLSATSYSVNEGDLFAAINVTRTGDTSAPATVKYATSDATDVNFACNPTTAGQITGAASRKCDYHIAVGRLRFAAGETSKQIIISVVDDVYAEGTEVLTLTLSNPTGISLGSPNIATINIIDNDSVTGSTNPIDGTSFYVRMLYVDLLSREPDPAGFAGWVHRIDFCGQPGEPPPPCDRVTVGGDGFLRSGEFFDRQFFVIRLYRAGLGRILTYNDVGDLAYVSGFLSTSDLELNKQDVVAEIMSRPEFSNTYNGLGDAAYVDKLIQTAAVTIPQSVRDGWVAALTASTKTRAVVYRELSERQEVSDRYLHEAQVVSCYYGFFTRNPDGAYFSYLDRLDRGEINLGDLANAFINAAEYKQRFGP